MPPSSQEELFERAIALPPADRTAWIAAACGPDVPLRRRLESLLRAHDEAQGFMESPPPDLGPAAPEMGYVIREQRLDCLEPCLQKLRPEQRELAVEYFRDSGRQRIERRRDLARRLSITMNALGIRAFRIRDTLMTCVETCRHRRRQI